MGEFQPLHPHQQRVIVERDELKEKTEKLEAFLRSNQIFDTLSSEEQHSLRRQFVVMKQYLAILEDRITRFSLTQ